MRHSRFRKWYRFCVQAKFEGPRTHKAIMRIMKKISRSENLLDIGCGNGLRTKLYGEMLSTPREHIYGCELKKQHISEAKKTH